MTRGKAPSTRTVISGVIKVLTSIPSSLGLSGRTGGMRLMLILSTITLPAPRSLKIPSSPAVKGIFPMSFSNTFVLSTKIEMTESSTRIFQRCVSFALISGPVLFPE